ncbi:biotin-dependent carboxyltransferase family protein [Alkalihalobacillus trypoxylicola]|uniref:Carboxyltransferase domain-containing protein n=1 Tax=Alkalihalobacillus trypoxylicola TaxID=519424 RepID=A0A162EU04_9BACI|nr:biotin-dependent carboxyltransferase family protein [Alkalihalobacillus trypoxylicola]KYG33724.1 hypothetical protein AZF04_15995 [Alkalihalobacillus trypoxylicola]
MVLDTFYVERAGLLTTIQDKGRYHYMKSGISVSGVMDPYAAEIANILVNNDENEAVLEISIVGPTLVALVDGVISITGADLDARLDGKAVELWKSIHIKKGQRLTFRAASSGMRAYLAIQGGFEAEFILGSYSTYLAAAIGGIQGRAIKEGDILQSREDFSSNKSHLTAFSKSIIPQYKDQYEIRVIVGPDFGCFKKESYRTFFNSVYKVSNQSNRMGLRLIGNSIELKKGKEDILSDAIMFGTIQVPASGDPIVLMADRQTTGGYPRLATAITVDLFKLAQARSNDTLRFKEVSITEAQQLYRNYQLWLRFFRGSIKQLNMLKAKK